LGSLLGLYCVSSFNSAVITLLKNSLNYLIRAIDYF